MAVLPCIPTNEFVLISEIVQVLEKPSDPALVFNLLHQYKFKPHLLAKSVWMLGVEAPRVSNLGQCLCVTDQMLKQISHE